MYSISWIRIRENMKSYYIIQLLHRNKPTNILIHSTLLLGIFFSVDIVDTSLCFQHPLITVLDNTKTFIEYSNLIVSLPTQVTINQENTTICGNCIKYTNLSRSINSLSLCRFEDHLMEYLSDDAAFAMFVTNFRRNGKYFDSLPPEGTYIFIVSKFIANELKLQIENIRYRNNWNARARMLVLVTNKLSDDIDIHTWLHEVLQLFKKLHVVNVTILIWRSRRHDEFKLVDFIDIYTWYPYIQPFCSNNTLHVEQLGSIKITEKTSFQSLDLFPDKVSGHLHECPLKITTKTFPPYVIGPRLNPHQSSNANKGIFYDGIEPCFARFLAYKLGMQLRYRPPPEDDYPWADYQNGSWKGLLGDLQHSGYDLAMCAFFPTEKRSRDFEQTFPTNQEEMIWVVPLAGLAAPMRALVSLFPLDLTLVALVAGAASALVLRLAEVSDWSTPSDDIPLGQSKNPAASRSSVRATRTLSAWMTYAWAALLGAGVSAKTNRLLQRGVFYVWLMGGLIFACGFQSRIISAMQQPRRRHQVSSTQDILDEGLRVEWSAGSEIFFNKSKATDAAVLNRYVEVDNVTRTLNRIATSKDTATVATRAFATYSARQRALATGKESPFFLFPAVGSAYNMVMYLPRGHPLLHRVDAIVRAALENGLRVKCLSDFMRENSMSSSIVRRDRSMKMQQLKTAISSLCNGCAVAAGVFMLEVIVGRWRCLVNKFRTLSRNSYAIKSPMIGDLLPT